MRCLCETSGGTWPWIVGLLNINQENWLFLSFSTFNSEINEKSFSFPTWLTFPQRCWLLEKVTVSCED